MGAAASFAVEMNDPPTTVPTCGGQRSVPTPRCMSAF